MKSEQDSSISHLNEYIERWTVVEKKRNLITSFSGEVE